ncbi:hypothetical protein BDV93DRAFT_521789 [Ceratobasidium sp. AG-I]|nr:hypothetical protein BDV93DRAFT_521789 [Ceratobasidium sp. AG-I]
MSVPTAAPETAVYRQKLALHILPKHPALARYYASRSRKLNPSLPPLTPISCPQCENILLHGRGTVRVARQALVRDCYMCGSSSSVPRPPSQATNVFPSVRARVKSRGLRPILPRDEAVLIAQEVKVSPAVEPSAEDSSRQLPTPTSNPVQQPRPTPIRSNAKRTKAKSGLQGMLQRNRERETREAHGKSADSGGLASFLQGL